MNGRQHGHDGQKWLLVLCAGLFAILLLQLIFTRFPSNNPRALDFRMRYNEAECVKSGNDPYLVWNGTLEPGKYTPWDFKYLGVADELNLVHAYPPWEYAWMLPLTFMSRDSAEAVFRGLSWCGIAFIVGSAFVLGYWSKNQLWAGFGVAAAVLFMWYPLRVCLEFLNYGILISAAVLMALLCHKCRRDWLAGLFWSLTLLKPQLGGLFVVALLVRWKWRTLVSTGVVTVFGTMVSAMLCHRSPVEMVFSIAKYSHGQFTSTGFIPYKLFAVLEPYFGETVLISGSAFLGVLLSVVLCWVQRSCEDVFEWVMPPVLLSTLWAPVRFHDQSIRVIMLLGLVLAVVKGRKTVSCVCDMALIFLVVSFGIDDMLPVPLNITQMFALVLLFVRVIRFRPGMKCPVSSVANCGG